MAETPEPTADPDGTAPRRRASTRTMQRTPSTLQRLLRGKLGSDLDEFVSKRPRSKGRSRSISPSGSVANNIYTWDPMSLRIKSINWVHVLLAEYLPYAKIFSILFLFASIARQILSGTFDLTHAKALASDPISLEVAGLIALIVAYFARVKPSVYCMENVVFLPPRDWQVSKDDLMTMMRAQCCFTEDTLAFTQKILERSGTGESTAWPPSMISSRDGLTPAAVHVDAAREEAEAVIFPLVKEVLTRTKVEPAQIDILIINCSLFVPTPSLCALVCNEFGLREDVRTYNLGGMGCSANVIAVDLAKELLENRPGARAIVISTENLTQNLYLGNEKAMLLQNTLFRCGGCALLLSSRRYDSTRAKYKLLYSFRAQVSSDNSYRCVYQRQDENSNMGIALSKDIVKVAGQAMKRNFIQLGPYVLPLREQIKVGVNAISIFFVSRWKKGSLPFAEQLTVPQGYTPNFGKGIDHFCIHAGGRAVIEGVQKNLSLSDAQIAPSIQTLHDFGNTSSSSIWYEFDWIERFGGIKRGDRILQIAFGSGFKCNSAVWLALRPDESKRGVEFKQFDKTDGAR